MRSSNRFICMIVLVGLAVVLAGVSSARADVVWTAPSMTMTSPAVPTVVNVTLTIGSNATDFVNAYNLRVDLIGPGGVTFGTPVQATTNYVLNGLAGVAGWNAPLVTSTAIAGTDAANMATGNQNPLPPTRNLVTIPVNIAVGAVGTWQIVWAAGGFDTNSFDADGMEPAGYVFHNGTIQLNPDVIIPAPLAAWGGLALFGLMGLRRMRRHA